MVAAAAPPRTRSVAALAPQLEELNRFLGVFWQEAGLTEEGRLAFELALEEVFINVVTHGAHPGTSPPHVQLTLSHEGHRVRMVHADDGIPFDPLAQAAPDLDADLEHRPVGGLGIFLVRRMMDRVEYRHEAGRNVLCMEKQLP
ncbi:MAG: hypothetical protein RL026_952 [Pseudomonadota bacterium]